MAQAEPTYRAGDDDSFAADAAAAAALAPYVRGGAKPRPYQRVVYRTFQRLCPLEHLRPACPLRDELIAYDAAEAALASKPTMLEDLDKISKAKEALEMLMGRLGTLGTWGLLQTRANRLNAMRRQCEQHIPRVAAPTATEDVHEADRALPPAPARDPRAAMSSQEPLPDDYKAKVASIVAAADTATVTVKSIRRRLEKDLGLEKGACDAYKDSLKAHVTALLNESTPAAVQDVLEANPACYDADRVLDAEPLSSDEGASDEPATCVVCAEPPPEDCAVPCCGSSVCRDCLRGAAEAMGALFACPACRDRERFRSHCETLDIRAHDATPDYVAAGEAEPMERFCCAAFCACPRGPAFDACGDVDAAQRPLGLAPRVVRVVRRLRDPHRLLDAARRRRRAAVALRRLPTGAGGRVAAAEEVARQKEARLTRGACSMLRCI